MDILKRDLYGQGGFEALRLSLVLFNDIVRCCVLCLIACHFYFKAVDRSGGKIVVMRA